jgi:hypothetical protein
VPKTNNFTLSKQSIDLIIIGNHRSKTASAEDHAHVNISLILTLKSNHKSNVTLPPLVFTVTFSESILTPFWLAFLSVTLSPASNAG